MSSVSSLKLNTGNNSLGISEGKNVTPAPQHSTGQKNTGLYPVYLQPDGYIEEMNKLSGIQVKKTDRVIVYSPRPRAQSLWSAMQKTLKAGERIEYKKNYSPDVIEMLNAWFNKTNKDILQSQQMSISNNFNKPAPVLTEVHKPRETKMQSPVKPDAEASNHDDSIFKGVSVSYNNYIRLRGTSEFSNEILPKDWGVFRNMESKTSTDWQEYIKNHHHLSWSVIDDFFESARDKLMIKGEKENKPSSDEISMVKGFWLYQQRNMQESIWHDISALINLNNARELLTWQKDQPFLMHAQARIAAVNVLQKENKLIAERFPYSSASSNSEVLLIAAKIYSDKNLPPETISRLKWLEALSFFILSETRQSVKSASDFYQLNEIKGKFPLKAADIIGFYNDSFSPDWNYKEGVADLKKVYQFDNDSAYYKYINRYIDTDAPKEAAQIVHERVVQENVNPFDLNKAISQVREFSVIIPAVSHGPLRASFNIEEQATGRIFFFISFSGKYYGYSTLGNIPSLKEISPEQYSRFTRASSDRRSVHDIFSKMGGLNHVLPKPKTLIDYQYHTHRYFRTIENSPPDVKKGETLYGFLLAYETGALRRQATMMKEISPMDRIPSANALEGKDTFQKIQAYFKAYLSVKGDIFTEMIPFANLIIRKLSDNHYQPELKDWLGDAADVVATALTLGISTVSLSYRGLTTVLKAARAAKLAGVSGAAYRRIIWNTARPFLHKLGQKSAQEVAEFAFAPVSWQKLTKGGFHFLHKLNHATDTSTTSQRLFRIQQQGLSGRGALAAVRRWLGESELTKELNKLQDIVHNNRQMNDAERTAFISKLEQMARYSSDSESIADYAKGGEGNYSVINNYLRHGDDDELEEGVLASQETHRLLEDFRKLMDYNDYTYRAINTPAGIYGSQIKKGDLVMDKAFLSTSLSPHDTANEWGHWSDNVSVSNNSERVLFVLDKDIPKKFAGNNFLLNYLLIGPSTVLKVKKIIATTNYQGRKTIIVSLTIPSPQEAINKPVKNIWSGG